MRYLFAALSGLVLFLLPQHGHAQDAKLAVIVFPGVQNLPMFAAQAKGLYAKRGLNVEIKFTPNSDELRNGLAEGRYQIAHSAVDNAFALKDKRTSILPWCQAATTASTISLCSRKLRH
jgi:ABC-type nitrate/sulfonate/bicarbonate transport system substrate-binding protein